MSGSSPFTLFGLAQHQEPPAKSTYNDLRPTTSTARQENAPHRPILQGHLFSTKVSNGSNLCQVGRKLTGILS